MPPSFEGGSSFQQICVPSLELPEEIVAPPIVGDDEITVPSICAEPICLSVQSPSSTQCDRAPSASMPVAEGARELNEADTLDIRVRVPAVAAQDVDAPVVSTLNEETILAAPAKGPPSSLNIRPLGAVDGVPEQANELPGLRVTPEDHVQSRDDSSRTLQPSIHDTYIETRLASVHLKRPREKANPAMAHGAHADQATADAPYGIPSGSAGKHVEDNEDDFGAAAARPVESRPVINFSGRSEEESTKAGAGAVDDVQQGVNFKGLCVICLERHAIFACIPCGHQCVCQDDSSLLLHCPICRYPCTSCAIFFGPHVPSFLVVIVLLFLRAARRHSVRKTPRTTPAFHRPFMTPSVLTVACVAFVGNLSIPSSVSTVHSQEGCLRDETKR